MREFTYETNNTSRSLETYEWDNVLVGADRKQHLKTNYRKYMLIPLLSLPCA